MVCSRSSPLWKRWFCRTSTIRPLKRSTMPLVYTPIRGPHSELIDTPCYSAGSASPGMERGLTCVPSMPNLEDTMVEHHEHNDEQVFHHGARARRAADS